MLRELKVNGQKMADATYTADVALVRGMAVQKNAGEAVLVSAATGENIFFVDNQPIPTGINTLKGELSDYDDAFEKIDIGGSLVLKSYTVGEEIAIDQITGTPADGTYLVAGTDGKLVAGTTGQISYAISRGAYTDAGSHSLYAVEFVNAHTCA
jgi:hypothetical protein